MAETSDPECLTQQSASEQWEWTLNGQTNQSRKPPRVGLIMISGAATATTGRKAPACWARGTAPALLARGARCGAWRVRRRPARGPFHSHPSHRRPALPRVAWPRAVRARHALPALWWRALSRPLCRDNIARGMSERSERIGWGGVWLRSGGIERGRPLGPVRRRKDRSRQARTAASRNRSSGRGLSGRSQCWRWTHRQQYRESTGPS